MEKIKIENVSLNEKLEKITWDELIVRDKI